MLSLMGKLSGFGPVAFEIAASFCFQYFVLLIVLSTLYFFVVPKSQDSSKKSKLPPLLLCSLVVIFIDALAVAPFYCDFAGRPNATVQPGTTNILKLVQFNVYTPNRKYKEVCDFVSSVSPDIVVFEEVNDVWEKELTLRLNQYPYRKIVARADNFGSAIFSRIPFTEEEVITDAYCSISYPKITIDFGGQALSVLCSHPIPPVHQNGLMIRNKQLLDIAAQRKKWDKSLVIAGDLNCTPFSDIFSKFIKHVDMFDSENSFGYQPTWPEPLCLLRVPIDHVLISKDLAVQNRYIGPSLGSDHLPLCVEIVRR